MDTEGKKAMENKQIIPNTNHFFKLNIQFSNAPNMMM